MGNENAVIYESSPQHLELFWSLGPRVRFDDVVQALLNHLYLSHIVPISNGTTMRWKSCRTLSYTTGLESKQLSVIPLQVGGESPTAGVSYASIVNCDGKQADNHAGMAADIVVRQPGAMVRVTIVLSISALYLHARFFSV